MQSATELDRPLMNGPIRNFYQLVSSNWIMLHRLSIFKGIDNGQMIGVDGQMATIYLSYKMPYSLLDAVELPFKGRPLNFIAFELFTEKA